MAVLLAGCAPQVGSEQGREIYWLYNFFMVAAAVVFVVVAAWWCGRWCASATTARTPNRPRSTTTAMWRLVPLPIVYVLVVASFKSLTTEQAA
jgi:heme/copper-type cytochrome/quinol oxidase subunit 2